MARLVAEAPLPCIVTCRRAAEGGALGSVMLGDEMIDEASRKVCLKLKMRGERAGLVRTGA